MKNETCSSEMIEMVLQGSIGLISEIEINNGTAVTSSGLVCYAMHFYHLHTNTLHDVCSISLCTAIMIYFLSFTDSR